MADEATPVRVQITLTGVQAATIDSFQRTNGLDSRAEAIRLLLEIGMDSVTSPGRRFWDRAIPKPTE